MEAAKDKAPVGAGASRNEILFGSECDSSPSNSGCNGIFPSGLKPPPYPVNTRAKGYRFELNYRYRLYVTLKVRYTAHAESQREYESACRRAAMEAGV